MNLVLSKSLNRSAVEVVAEKAAIATVAAPINRAMRASRDNSVAMAD